LARAGIAIASIRPPKADDSETLRQARIDGYCVTRGQLQAGAVGVAAPLLTPIAAPFVSRAALGVALEDLDIDSPAKAAMACARMLVGKYESLPLPRRPFFISSTVSADGAGTARTCG